MKLLDGINMVFSFKQKTTGKLLWYTKCADLLTSMQFPIHPQQAECSYSKNNRGARMSGIVRIRSGDESSLLSAVTSVGPVSVAVDASSNAFRV